MASSLIQQTVDISTIQMDPLLISLGEQDALIWLSALIGAALAFAAYTLLLHRYYKTHAKKRRKKISAPPCKKVHTPISSPTYKKSFIPHLTWQLATPMTKKDNETLEEEEDSLQYKRSLS